MASLGSFYIGGSEGLLDSNIVCNSGACFDLISPSKMNKVSFFKEEGWWVEVKDGENAIVARTEKILAPEETLNQSYAMCQKFLDILSVTKIMDCDMKNPLNSHLILFKEENKFVIRVFSRLSFVSNVKASLTVIHDGKEIPSPQRSEPEWTPAFRYYRLSRMNTDLYEAYRNLFLGFEALLSDIVPLSHDKEPETVWLKRALNEINLKIPLSKYVPNGTQNPVGYFFQMQYGIRCDLFHAKKKKYILPYSDSDITDIAEAYIYLHQLWRQIIASYPKYNVPNSSGSITSFGFKRGIDGLISEGYEITGVDVPKPPKSTDSQVNPSDYPEIQFSDLNYDSTSLPGYSSINGSVETDAIHKIRHLHKFCLSSQGHLLMYNFFEQGIFLEGIDKLECSFNIQLKDNNLP